MNRQLDAANSSREIRVWDVPVRVVHWLLVALVSTSVATGLTGGNVLRIHRASGYAILTLVLFRLMWGVAGTRTARFASFLRGPGAVLEFARDTLAMKRPLHAGHNPLAGWHVLALLAALLVQATTGLFANDDIFFQGPLAPLVSSATSNALTTVHRTNAWILLTLVALHVGAVLFHLVVERRNFVTAMFTGRARWPASVAAPELGRSRPWLALVLFMAACAAVALVVNAAGLGRHGGGGEPW
jgi:cytochrome b